MPMILRMRSVILLVVLSLLAGIPAFAQMETATLSGVIQDPKGGVVPDAEVTATRIETGSTVTTKTNGAGIYFFTGLMPGHYHLVVRKPGFKEIAIKEFQLYVQDKLEQNFSLEIGSVSETVTVNADDLHLNTTDATVKTLVDRQFVKEMPLNGRSFQTLFQLTPGAVIASASYSEQGQFSINGQRADSNSFMVDGVSANVNSAPGFSPGQSVSGSLPALTVGGGTNGLVSVDALQEFSIQTSGYGAEYGRTPGGQISILTRSGTNEFHGALFDYVRNDVFDASDWFANNLGLKKAALRQNDFGGVLGGPVVKDKTFFFFSYEGLRLRQPQTGISDVPTVAARQAATPSSRIILDAFPLPTGADEGNGIAPGNYTFSIPSRLDAESLRLDHAFGHHLTAFARYNRSTSNSETRGGFEALTAIHHNGTKLHTATGGLTWTMRPTIVNDIRFNWSRSLAQSFITNDTLGGAVPVALSAVFPSDQDPANSSLFFQFTVGNNTAIATGANSHNVQRQVNLIDSLSWQIRSHILKFGVDYRRLTPEINLVHYSQQLTADDPLAFGSGNLSSGFPQFVTGFFGPVEAAYANYSIFVQDTWKATSNLTLTYGLRWDYNPAPTAHGANGLPLLTIVGISDLANLAPAPVGTPLYHATVDNFAPRVGLSYGIRDSSKYPSVVRAGFGLFYDTGNTTTGNALTNFPFFNTSFPAATSFPLSPSDSAIPPATTTPSLASMNAYPKTLRQPYTYHWNLGLEQTLGSKQTLSIGYVAAAGHSLIEQDLIQAGQSSPLPPAFSSVLYTNNAGYSHYNSLQAQFRRRQTKGLEILGSYTWAHSLDNVSKDSAFSLSALQVLPSLNYGDSDFDIRHTGSVAIDYQIPDFLQSGLAGRLLHGWGLNTFLIARSAPPVDVSILEDAGFGFAFYRPDVVPGVPKVLRDTSAPHATRLNAAAFSVPPSGQGNLGRNVLRGFPLFQQDLSIRRNFHLRDRLQLQARLEAFNVFNHPNFAPPSSFLGFACCGTLFRSSSFGLSQSMFSSGAGNSSGVGGFNALYQVGGPRSLQLALKLEF
jgi:hypothetical protein